MKKTKIGTLSKQSAASALATQPTECSQMQSEQCGETAALRRILEAMDSIALLSLFVAKGISDDDLAELGRADRKYIGKTYRLSRSEAKNFRDLCRPAAIAEGWFPDEDEIQDTSGSEDNDQSTKEDPVGRSSRPARPKNFIHLNIVRARHVPRRVSPKKIMQETELSRPGSSSMTDFKAPSITHASQFAEFENRRPQTSSSRTTHNTDTGRTCATVATSSSPRRSGNVLPMWNSHVKVQPSKATQNIDRSNFWLLPATAYSALPSPFLMNPESTFSKKGQSHKKVMGSAQKKKLHSKFESQIQVLDADSDKQINPDVRTFNVNGSDLNLQDSNCISLQSIGISNDEECFQENPAAQSKTMNTIEESTAASTATQHKDRALSPSSAVQLSPRSNVLVGVRSVLGSVVSNVSSRPSSASAAGIAAAEAAAAAAVASAVVLMSSPTPQDNGRAPSPSSAVQLSPRSNVLVGVRSVLGSVVSNVSSRPSSANDILQNEVLQMQWPESHKLAQVLIQTGHNDQPSHFGGPGHELDSHTIQTQLQQINRQSDVAKNMPKDIKVGASQYRLPSFDMEASKYFGKVPVNVDMQTRLLKEKHSEVSDSMTGFQIGESHYSRPANSQDVTDSRITPEGTETMPSEHNFVPTGARILMGESSYHFPQMNLQDSSDSLIFDERSNSSHVLLGSSAYLLPRNFGSDIENASDHQVYRVQAIIDSDAIRSVGVNEYSVPDISGFGAKLELRETPNEVEYYSKPENQSHLHSIVAASLKQDASEESKDNVSFILLGVAIQGSLHHMMIESGFVEALLFMCEIGSTEVRLNAIGAIYHLSQDSEAIQIIGRGNGFQTIVKLCSEGSLVTKQNALGVLENITAHAEFGAEVLKLNIIPMLCERAQVGNPVQKLRALGVLKNLATLDAAQNDILTNRVVVVVEKLLDLTQKIRDLIVHILRLLSIHKIHDVSLRKMNAIVTLVDFALTGSILQKNHATAALRNLSGDVLNYDVFREVSAIPMMLNFCKSGSTEQILNAVGFIRNLAMDEYNQASIIKLNAVPILVNICKTIEDAEIIEEAGAALGNLAANDLCAPYIEASHAIDVMLALLASNHVLHRSVAIKGIRNMARLSNELAHNPDAIRLLIEGIRGGENDDQIHALLALEAISKSEQSMDTLGKLGCIEELHEILRAESRAIPEAKACGFRILKKLSSGPLCQAKMISLGFLPILVSTQLVGVLEQTMDVAHCIVNIAAQEIYANDIKTSGGLTLLVSGFKDLGSPIAALCLEGLGSVARLRCHQQYLRDMGAYMSLSHACRMGSVHQKDLAASALMYMADFEENRDRLMTIAPSLLQLMQEGFSAHKGFSAAILSKLTMNPDYLNPLREIGFIAPLVTMCTSGNRTEKDFSVASLMNMATNNINKAAIRDLGGIPPLVELCKTGSISQIEKAAGALGNLAVDAQNQDAIRVASGLRPLVDLLLFKSGTPNLRENATVAIKNLAVNIVNQRVFREIGALRPLLDLVKNGVSLQRQHAAGALWNLALHPANKDEMRRCGCFKPLLQLLVEGKTDEQFNALGKCMCGIIECFLNEWMHCQTRMFSLLAERCMHRADSRSGALAAACQDHQENQQMLRKEGILRVLLTICNSENSAERMRDKATAIMISIVGHPDTNEQ
jgi:hypothetical protein